MNKATASKGNAATAMTRAKKHVEVDLERALETTPQKAALLTLSGLCRLWLLPVWRRRRRTG